MSKHKLIQNRKNSNQAKTGGFTEKIKSLNPAIKFILFFILSLAVLGSVYSFLTVHFHDDMGGFLNLTATLSSGLARIFPGDVSSTDNYVNYNGFIVEIIDECTGLLEMVIYLAAVLAFSTTIRKKLIGIAIGIPAIFLFNVIRILVLLLAGASSRELFDFMHIYFWQGTLIIIISSVWIGWLYLVVFREKKRVVAVSN